MGDIVSLRPESPPEQLERLARRPLQVRRDYLLWLAARLRELDALAHDQDDQQQLELAA